MADRFAVIYRDLEHNREVETQFHDSLDLAVQHAKDLADHQKAAPLRIINASRETALDEAQLKERLESAPLE